MTDKHPSLQEIADMPYPHSIKAIHKHYDPTWGLVPKPEDEGKMCFKIAVEWHEITEEGDVYTIWAESEEAAKDEAKDRVYAENAGQIEIQSCSIAKPRKAS